jgi:anti-sigma B factor antagonist
MSDFESVVAEIGACAEKRDFAGALALVKENRDALGKRIQGDGVKEALKKTTDDRLLLSLVDGAEFETRPLDKALVRLEKLLSFQKDSRVLNATWGLGKVTRIDYFYRRITVDFRTRKGHQFTYAAAADMLERAPENHILVLRESDPARVEAMLKDEMESITDLTIDLEKLVYTSSAGLRVLLSAQKTMNKRGSMTIRKVRPEIMEIFDMVGFTDLLNIKE